MPYTEPIPAAKPDKLITRRGFLGLMGALGTGALVGCGETPRITLNRAEVTPTPAGAPTATPEAVKDKDPLSAQNLWEATPEQRLELYRSLLPESIIKTPKKFVETKIGITAALYNMLGDQAAYDAWLKERYANNKTGTNQEWADYTYETILDPAFTLLDGRKPVGDNKQGIWNMAARAGFIVEQQHMLSEAGGTPIKLPPYKYSYNILSVSPKNTTDTQFDVDVKLTEGDNITPDTIEKVSNATGQHWKIDTAIGGALAFTWMGVHYDNKTKIALTEKAVVTASE